MQRTRFEDSICPVARSLDTIGEWWSLLIVRDAFQGTRRFSDFQRKLGLARNVLSARLKKLVACGIMEMVPASDGSAYQEYVLTEKGRELLPVLVAMRQWGERYLFAPGESHSTLIDKKLREPLQQLSLKNAAGDALAPEDIELVMPPETKA